MNKRMTHTGLSLMLAVVMSVSLILPKMSFAKDTQYNPNVSFVFSDTAISESGTGDGYEIESTALTITQSGTYAVSGSCANGSITVKKGVKDVNLILDGLTLSADDTAPISIHKSSAVNLIVKENTDNYLSDSDKNNDEVTADAENAVIKCKDGAQVVISGSGNLEIKANGKNGIKSGASTEEDGDASLIIKEVHLQIDAPVNDAINAESDLTVLSGTLQLSAGDDAVHSDTNLIVGAADAADTPVIQIDSCYEGLEGANVRILSGDIKINAEDDGINAANADLSGHDFSLDIDGGTVYVNTEKGDGLDSNGTLTITGGNVTVFSTSSGANSPLDSDGEFKITGGTVLAIGNSGMAQSPISGSQSYLVFGAGAGRGGRGGGFGPMQGENGNGAFDPNQNLPSFDGRDDGQNPPQPRDMPQDDTNGDTARGSRPQMLQGDRGFPGGEGMTPPQDHGDRTGDIGTPPEMPQGDGTFEDSSAASSISINKDSAISITDSSGNLLCSTTALRTANYVFYSDAALSEDESYTLTVDGSQAATTTVSESAVQRQFGGGMMPPGQNGQDQPGQAPNRGEDQNAPRDFGSKFRDVSRDAWYFDAVSFVNQKNWMRGDNEDTFSPDDALTRAMFVTILYRLENEPQVDKSADFSDLEDQSYYEAAVHWATENQIVSGTDTTTFSPNEPITREQMAAILYRYAAYKGMDTSADETADYTDSSSISDYAKPCVNWAGQHKIMTGDDKGSFLPGGTATRAEAASVLMRISQIS